jgi:hypothetical protein
MKKVRGRKRKVQHDAVVKYAKLHPDMFQTDIAAYFGVTQALVSMILRKAGVSGGWIGRPLKRKSGETEEEHEWEKKLHDAGLGMERGTRINKQRVLYGYDPLKESREHESATSDSFF